ncbi:uncharacterized protein LOC124887824 [Capsicum annuum]|uniref:uncharacterized protein LOC124887824 n=1 Tax=Capsicum annuum TaxID=4072 RepID=UPI001FB084BD|nr:uncharacterized protein LOC124887824 [Capsicum annuum]
MQRDCPAAKSSVEGAKTQVNSSVPPPQKGATSAIRNRRNQLLCLVKILRRIGAVAYELELPASLGSVRPVFHVTMLKKCIGDHSLVLPVEEIKVTDSLTYEEEPVAILDHQVLKLRNKEIASVKVRWRSQKVEKATWEFKEDMQVRYSSLFDLENDEMEGTNDPKGG